MKNLFAVAVWLAAVTSQGDSFTDPGTGRFRGHYVGVVLPVGADCTTERFLMSVEVAENGEMRGEIADFAGERRASIEHRLDGFGVFGPFNTGTNMLPPFPPCFPLCDPEPGSGWLVKGRANARSGVLRGSVDARPRDGCRYTFTLYRQFRNN